MAQTPGYAGIGALLAEATPQADAHSNEPKVYIWSGWGLEGAVAVLVAAT
jgi:hypothetical protein